MKKLLVLLSIFAINTYAVRTYNVDGQKAVISSDSTTEYSNGHAEYHGNVIFTQGDLVINADNGTSTKNANVVHFWGRPATFERGSVEGRAREITYYKNKHKLVLKGNPRLGAGDNEVVGADGEVLVFDLENNSANIFEVEAEQQ